MYAIILTPDIPKWFTETTTTTPTIYGPFDSEDAATAWMIRTKSFQPYVITKLENEMVVG